MAWKLGHEGLQVAVPSYFKCPISLDLMSDPVSVCTGMTYDRSSIEKWLDDGHNTCPATMQILDTQDLIPNHTLRRLIQAWCVANKSMGVERIPTPRQPLDRRQVELLLRDIAAHDIDALKKLREKAKESLRNRKCIVAAEAVAVLSSILSSTGKMESIGAAVGAMDQVCEEIVGILSVLPMDESLRKMVGGAYQLRCLSRVLRKGSLDARINAAMLLEDLASMDEHLNCAIGATAGVIEAMVELLQEDLNHRAVKAALRGVSAIATSRRNCKRVIEVGTVDILVEMLPSAEKSTTEVVLVILERICRCAEGRAAVAEHALAIPAIANKMSCVASFAAAEAAISIMWVVCRVSAEGESVRERMVEADLFQKMLLLFQMEFGAATKHKMADILRLLRTVCEGHPSKCNLDDARFVAM